MLNVSLSSFPLKLEWIEGVAHADGGGVGRRSLDEEVPLPKGQRVEAHLTFRRNVDLEKESSFRGLDTDEGRMRYGRCLGG